MSRRSRSILLTALSIGGAFVLCAAAGLLWLVSRPRPRPETPLEKAVMAGSPERLKEALAQGGGPDALDRRGLTPMIWAARNGRLDAVRQLAAAGADPDRRDEAVNGWTPLLHAVHKDQAGAVRALLAAGAAVDRPNPKGLTPLMLAAAQGNAETTAALLAAGADPRAQQEGGGSVFRYAVMGGNPRVVRALLRAAPDLHLGDSWGDRIAWAFDTVRREIR
jgi:ankyrin repeat protein